MGLAMTTAARQPITDHLWTLHALVLALSLYAAGCDAAPPTPALGIGSSNVTTAPPPTTPSTKPPSAPKEPGFGEIAFKTFQSGGTRIVFTTESKARVTWQNMSGSAVVGTYTHVGRDIEIQWDPAATNYGSRSELFRQMGPCSMARHTRIDPKGAVHDDSPMIYQQKKPRCDTIRLTD
jgi:hypothetical protein